MAEQNDLPPIEQHEEVKGLTRRDRTRRTVATRPTAVRKARAAKAPATRAPKPAKTRPARRPLRSLAILTMVGALVATVALPAYTATFAPADAQTLSQIAADDAQSFIVASDATGEELARDSYSATTPEEIAKKKAEEAAAARARLAASVASVYVDLSMINPGTGAVRWPMAGGSFRLGDGWGAGRGHQGIDMLAPQGTPIYAAASGVVKVSQDGFGAYGNAVTIDHVIGGQRVSTLYAHIMNGGRQVVPGQYVEVGQLIALVGSTGRSTANHLHFEVFVNGSHVDPLAWLQANAG